MEINQKIFVLLSEQNKTAKQLSDFIDVRESSISAWKKEGSYPSSKHVLRISEFFGVQVGELFDESALSNSCNDDIIDKVRKLSLDDANKLNQFLDWISSAPKETKKSKNPAKTTQNVIPFTNIEKSSDVDIPMLRPLMKYNLEASAGSGIFLDSEDYEIVEVGNEVPIKANFGVDIRGDSMEPDYPDGCTVWVRRQEILENGQIGIFVLNDKGYLKKYKVTKDGEILVSLNPKYDPIEVKKHDSFRRIGLVLGITT